MTEKGIKSLSSSASPEILKRLGALPSTRITGLS